MEVRPTTWFCETFWGILEQAKILDFCPQFDSSEVTHKLQVIGYSVVTSYDVVTGCNNRCQTACEGLSLPVPTGPHNHPSTTASLAAELRLRTDSHALHESAIDATTIQDAHPDAPLLDDANDDTYSMTTVL